MKGLIYEGADTAQLLITREPGYLRSRCKDRNITPKKDLNAKWHRVMGQTGITLQCSERWGEVCLFWGLNLRTAFTKGRG